MSSLNFFIAPMSQELKERTRLAHVLRGLAWFTTTPAAAKAGPRHPFEIAYTLGLQQQINFWKPAVTHETLLPIHSRQALELAFKYWKAPLCYFDGRLFASRFDLFPQDQHKEILNLLHEQLHALDFVENIHHYPISQRGTSMQMTDKLPKDILNKLEMSLSSLEQALLAKDPMMPQHLRSTHQILINYPETVHLLDDNEIARIIDAAELHMKTQIIKDTVSKGAGTKKKVSASDL